jgi:4-amino-4-deoxy-L-arabinose transferase-like glycosyltransferase
MAKCWFITGFIFLSIASTKRVLYLMPIFAPISLLSAWYIDTTFTRDTFRKIETFFISVFAFVPLLAGVAVIPFFVYASKKYGFGLPVAEACWIIFLSLAAISLSVIALRRRRKNGAGFWAFSGASIYALLLLGLIAAMPLLDRFKSFVPFCNAVKAAVPVSSGLYGYQPDETLRGAVPFYTGRFLKETGSLTALEEAIGKEKEAFVVIRDKRGELERELLSTGKLAIVARQAFDTDRSLVLLTNRTNPSGKPASAE